MLIYLFGADGTGKTTQARLLERNLDQIGISARRSSIKQHHTISFVVLVFFRTVGVLSKADLYYGFHAPLRDKIRNLWKMIELLSVLPVVLLKVTLPNSFGAVIICDRFLLDTLVTLSYFLKDPSILDGWISRLLLALIPDGSLLVFLDAQAQVLIERKKDEPLTLELVEYYRWGYRRLLRRRPPDLTIDSHALPIEEAQREIMKIVLQYLRAKDAHTSIH